MRSPVVIQELANTKRILEAKEFCLEHAERGGNELYKQASQVVPLSSHPLIRSYCPRIVWLRVSWTRCTGE